MITNIIEYQGGDILENFSEMFKGILDGLVLEIISREETYGYEIARQLNALGFRDLAQATIYALLLRLEKNGMVKITKRSSKMGPPRKFYALNERGHRELVSFWARWDYLKERVQLLRNGKEGKDGYY